MTEQFAYPLELKFRIGTLANDFTAKDANGHMVAYVRQKIMKLKSEVEIFKDTSKTELLYVIKADKVIGINFNFMIYDAKGQELGRIFRKGMASIFKAHYEVWVGNLHVYTIREKNPWVKVWDALLGELPLLGILSAYLLHPAYRVLRVVNDEEVALVKKKPSFFGRKFSLTKSSPHLLPEEEGLLLVACMRMLLLERRRG